MSDTSLKQSSRPKPQKSITACCFSHQLAKQDSEDDWSLVEVHVKPRTPARLLSDLLQCHHSVLSHRYSWNVHHLQCTRIVAHHSQHGVSRYANRSTQSFFAKSLQTCILIEGNGHLKDGVGNTVELAESYAKTRIAGIAGSAIQHTWWSLEMCARAICTMSTPMTTSYYSALQTRLSGSVLNVCAGLHHMCWCADLKIILPWQKKFDHDKNKAGRLACLLRHTLPQRAACTIDSFNQLKACASLSKCTLKWRPRVYGQPSLTLPNILTQRECLPNTKLIKLPHYAGFPMLSLISRKWSPAEWEQWGCWRVSYVLKMHIHISDMLSA